MRVSYLFVSWVWFVTGYVSFPILLLGCLEAAQRRVISSRECRVQELSVHQDHKLHRRGESPPAQRSGPLAGNCKRGGAPKMFLFILKVTKTIYPSIQHLTLYFLSPSSDCDKGERSAGVAEEVWKQPTGSGGDEVRSCTWGCPPPMHYSIDLTCPCVSVKWYYCVSMLSVWFSHFYHLTC